MKSTQNNWSLRNSNSGNVAMPRMAAYAGFLMLMVPFFLYRYGSQLTDMGIVHAQKLPITHTIACKGPNEFAVISLDQQGKFAFSVSGVSPQVQAAAIQDVAYQRGISLDSKQCTELQSLPFLTSDIDELPHLLSLPSNRRGQLVELAKFKPLSEAQLIACVVAARQYNKSRFKRPIAISLRIDTEAKSSKVMLLLEKLQAHGFNRISYQNQIF